MNKKLTYLKIALLVFAALVVFYSITPMMRSTIAPDETSQKEAEIQLSFDYGDGQITAYSPKVHEGETLFELMHRLEIENKVQLSYKSFPGLGVLIESIGEKKNGEGGAYWQFWINGEYAKVGASEYIPKGGDKILWKFSNQKDF
ncbi:MAG: DUF4430 domain-containing protein [bacterium]|nr:DUF4430 domain-containing protein [bacterium]